jgi:large subunit ribosomal protein L13e
VKRLSDYKSKIILFPRRDGQFKKGEINDSTADKLKGVEQNKTPSLFGLPPVDKTSAPEPITKEMLAAKVYYKLRTERINKRYNGKRLAAAKKAEEAKK